jgi:hypothetical protein
LFSSICTDAPAIRIGVAIEYETPGVHQERGDNGEGRGQMATALGMATAGFRI